MKINALPKYDGSDNPTNCCPGFHPDGWDEQELHFKEVKKTYFFYTTCPKCAKYYGENYVVAVSEIQ